MKTITTLALAALGITALATACSVDTTTPEQEQVGSNTEASCSSPQAVNVVLAGIATSAALEMHRWLPERDFVMTSDGLALSQYAPPRCPGRVCKFTQQFLNLQNWNAHGMIIEGQSLDVGVLRSRVASLWQRQMTCNSRPDNGFGDDCPVEYHDLAFSYRTPGSCDMDYWFHAYHMGTTNPLMEPKQLKNKLIFLGYPDNPYLAFDTQGDDVKIDPGGNSQGGGATGSGSATIFQVTPNVTSSPYCTTSIGDGVVSPGGATAALGSQCQCMTTPTAQAVTTFKASSVAGWLKCKA